MSNPPAQTASASEARKTRRLRGIALIASLLFALGLFEVGLRIVGDRIWYSEFKGPWHLKVYDPFIPWESPRGVEIAGLEMNAFGLRGPETTLEKPEGVIRVLTLGDSSTYGIALSDSNTPMIENYPDVMRRVLARTGRDEVEILNGGVVGYSSSIGLRLLVHRLLEFEPDVVTVRFGFNGHTPSWDPSLRSLEPRSPLARGLLYAAADTGIGKLGMHLIRRFKIGAPEPGSVMLTGLDQFEHDLRRFAELAEQEGFELVVLDYPLRAPERGLSKKKSKRDLNLVGADSVEELNEIHGAWQARQQAVVEELEIPYLDTARRCAGQAGQCFTDYDIVHPSEFGQKLTARMLLKLLEDEGLIPPRNAADRAPH